MTTWEWYQDTNTFRIFFHLLVTANYEDKKWRGILIKRGQVVTSRNSLEKSLNISSRSIRTVLTNLQATNELTIKTTNRFSVITLVKYDYYQSNPDEPTNQPTNQPTPTKEDKKKINTYKKTMKTINYDTGEEIEPKEKIKLSQEQNNLLIAIGVLWANLLKVETGLEDHELPLNNINKPIRTAYLKHKFTYDDFSNIFKDWMKTAKQQDKANFYFCLGEQNITKYKVSKKKTDSEENIKRLRRM